MRKLGLAVLGLAAVAAATGCSAVQLAREFAVTVPWENYKQVDVQVRNGAVELRSAAVNEVRVKGCETAGAATVGEAQRLLDAVEVYVGRDAERPETLLVELRVPEELHNADVAAQVEIELPQPCAARVQTSNASIRVAKLAGPVELRTSNGRVEAEQIDGPVHAETSNGSIRLTTVRGDVQAATSNGRVVAEGVRGQAMLRSSNGSLRLVMDADVVAGAELHTSNGSIHATLPRGMGADVRAKTTNGRLDISGAGIELDGSRFTGQVRGGGPVVVAETSNGSIRIDWH